MVAVVAEIVHVVGGGLQHELVVEHLAPKGSELTAMSESQRDGQAREEELAPAEAASPARARTTAAKARRTSRRT